VHAVIAMRRGPHWLLSDPDAKAYGLALANALRHIPVQVAQKWIDFTALGCAVFAYEGPRIGMDMQLRAQRQRPAQRPPQAMGQVFQFRPPAGPNPAPQQPPAPMDGEMTYEPELEPA